MFTLYTPDHHAYSAEMTVVSNPADAPGICRFSATLTRLN
jgi:hypothetical protein